MGRRESEVIRNEAFRYTRTPCRERGEKAHSLLARAKYTPPNDIQKNVLLRVNLELELFLNIEKSVPRMIISTPA